MTRTRWQMVVFFLVGTCLSLALDQTCVNAADPDPVKQALDDLVKAAREAEKAEAERVAAQQKVDQTKKDLESLEGQKTQTEEKLNTSKTIERLDKEIAEIEEKLKIIDRTKTKVINGILNPGGGGKLTGAEDDLRVEALGGHSVPVVPDSIRQSFDKKKAELQAQLEQKKKQREAVKKKVNKPLSEAEKQQLQQQASEQETQIEAKKKELARAETDLETKKKAARAAAEREKAARKKYKELKEKKDREDAIRKAKDEVEKMKKAVRDAMQSLKDKEAELTRNLGIPNAFAQLFGALSKLLEILEEFGVDNPDITGALEKGERALQRLSEILNDPKSTFSQLIREMLEQHVKSLRANLNRLKAARKKLEQLQKQDKAASNKDQPKKTESPAVEPGKQISQKTLMDSPYWNLTDGTAIQAYAALERATRQGDLAAVSSVASAADSVSEDEWSAASSVELTQVTTLANAIPETVTRFQDTARGIRNDLAEAKSDPQRLRQIVESAGADESPWQPSNLNAPVSNGFPALVYQRFAREIASALADPQAGLAVVKGNARSSSSTSKPKLTLSFIETPEQAGEVPPSEQVVTVEPETDGRFTVTVPDGWQPSRLQMGGPDVTEAVIPLDQPSAFGRSPGGKAQWIEPRIQTQDDSDQSPIIAWSLRNETEDGQITEDPAFAQGRELQSHLSRRFAAVDKWLQQTMTGVEPVERQSPFPAVVRGSTLWSVLNSDQVPTIPDSGFLEQIVGPLNQFDVSVQQETDQRGTVTESETVVQAARDDIGVNVSRIPDRVIVFEEFPREFYQRTIPADGQDTGRRSTQVDLVDAVTNSTDFVTRAGNSVQNAVSGTIRDENHRVTTQVVDTQVLQRPLSGAMTTFVVEIRDGNGQLIPMDRAAVQEAFDNDPQLAGKAGVAEPRDAETVPNDPHFTRHGSWGEDYADQWSLQRVGFHSLDEEATTAWPANARQLQAVTVAVIGSGVDWTHPEMLGQMWVNTAEDPYSGIDDDGNGLADDLFGWNFREENNDVMDYGGHDTHVAGLIAARSNNAYGIAGINPAARIMALKVANFLGQADAVSITRAILYAVNNGARVINISYGGERPSPIEERAIQYASSRGVLVVVAAGNQAVDAAGYAISSSPNVLTVAGSTTTDQRASFSNWGQPIDLSAPAMDVLSLRARGTDFLLYVGDNPEYVGGTAVVGRRGDLYRASGTSFAAPLVSGAASLLLSKNPALTVDQVRNLLVMSARDIDVAGWDQNTGAGVLNVADALQADPDHFLFARVSRITPVRNDDGIAVQVHGRAEGSSLKGRWLQIAFGATPGRDAWTTVDFDKQGVTGEGLLGTIPIQRFDRRGEWSIRLLVQDDRKTIRQARATLSLQ